VSGPSTSPHGPIAERAPRAVATRRSITAQLGGTRAQQLQHRFRETKWIGNRGAITQRHAGAQLAIGLREQDRCRGNLSRVQCSQVRKRPGVVRSGRTDHDRCSGAPTGSPRGAVWRDACSIVTQTIDLSVSDELLKITVGEHPTNLGAEPRLHNRVRTLTFPATLTLPWVR
jgi:hypothetical protein